MTLQRTSWTRRLITGIVGGFGACQEAGQSCYSLQEEDRNEGGDIPFDIDVGCDALRSNHDTFLAREEKQN